MSAKSVDVAEHRSTVDSALDGGLAAGLKGGLRTALDDVQMHRLNRNETCHQNARVIRSVPQLDPRELELRNHDDLDTPRAVSGNGVSDRQEMA